MKNLTRIIVLATSLILCVTLLSACGNRSMGLGNYDFHHIHVTTHQHSACYTVEKWHDNEGEGIEVKTKEAGYMFLSEGTYILIENESSCPFC